MTAGVGIIPFRAHLMNTELETFENRWCRLSMLRKNPLKWWNNVYFRVYIGNVPEFNPLHPSVKPNCAFSSMSSIIKSYEMVKLVTEDVNNLYQINDISCVFYLIFLY